MGDDSSTGIINLADAFSERYLGEGELEIELRTMVWDHVIDRHGNKCYSDMVEMRRFYVCIDVLEVSSQTEIGEVWYDLGGGSVPRHMIDEQNVFDNIIKFLSILNENGVKAKITSDSTELFEDMGTLKGRSVREAVVDSCQYKHLKRQEEKYLGLTSDDVSYFN